MNMNRYCKYKVETCIDATLRLLAQQIMIIKLISNLALNVSVVVDHRYAQYLSLTRTAEHLGMYNSYTVQLQVSIDVYYVNDIVSCATVTTYLL
jgi:hypothetical protein